MKCLIEECQHPAALRKGGLCHGHARRKQDGKPIEAPLRHHGDPRRTLFEAALALGDVGDDDNAYRRVIRRFWKAHHRAAAAARRQSSASR